MPGSIPELEEIGPQLEGNGLRSLREEARRLLNRRNVSFPGAQPVSLLKRHFEVLTKNELSSAAIFFVCEKSDGIRCLMYMTVMDPEQGNFTPATYLIDRKNNYYFIQELRFPVPEYDPTGRPTGNARKDKFHKDTILDGEIVLDILEDGTDKLKFLVFDALIVDGKNLMKRNLSNRLGYFMELVLKPYKAFVKQHPLVFANVPFVVEDKSMQLAYGIDMMFRDILPRLAHGNDGLIFTSLDGEYICGTDPHILKWKPDDENSIDFRLNLIFPPSTKGYSREITTRTPFLDIPIGTTFQLSVWSGDNNNNEANYAVWGDMYVPKEDWEIIQKAQDTELGLEDAIVECRWDKKVGVSGRWRFMRFRTDKDKANYISVAKNVQESIKDGVSKEELVKWAVDIKAGWRSRHPKK